ncbi:MAG: cupredoxin domain-containing protein [Gemmatimonadales bacterium]
MKRRTPAPPTVASGPRHCLLPRAAYTQVFESVGEYAYHCEPHPFMMGRVFVE